MSTDARGQAAGRAAHRGDEADGHRAAPRVRGHRAARRDAGAVTEGHDPVWDDERLVFLHIHAPGTAAHLAVEVDVVDPIRSKGWRFAGRDTVHTGGPVFDEVVAWYARPPTASPGRAVVFIDVERAEVLGSPVRPRSEAPPELARDGPALSGTCG